MTAAPKNLQNDRQYVPLPSGRKTFIAKRLLRTRSTFSQSLMVSVRVSKLGRTGLIFVEPGVKVNGTDYRDVLQLQHTLPDIRHIAGEFFIFQQHSASAHRARETILNARFLRCSVILYILFYSYYAALLPRRGPHIASHSVCLSVRPVIVYFRTSVTCFRQPCGRAVSFVLFTCQGRI